MLVDAPCDPRGVFNSVNFIAQPKRTSLKLFFIHFKGKEVVGRVVTSAFVVISDDPNRFPRFLLKNLFFRITERFGRMWLLDFRFGSIFFVTRPLLFVRTELSIFSAS